MAVEYLDRVSEEIQRRKLAKAAGAPEQRRTRLGPNSRVQAMALASPAQFLIVGGAAGGGKTRFLTLDPLRFIYPHPGHRRVHDFSAVIFRRQLTQITNEGGLWDESLKVYGPLVGAHPIPGNHEWRFDPDPDNTSIFPTIRYTHLQYDKTVLNWQGAQVPYFGFDEITHFSRRQVFYMLSRNRSGTGVVGQMRGTCNPDPDSFVAELVDWYIDGREEVRHHGRFVPNPTWGLAIPERAGKVRHFVVVGDETHWSDTGPEALLRYLPKDLPEGIDNPLKLIKSFAFIPFKVSDNADLLRANPEYVGNLLAMDTVERERLLGGNWKIRPASGKIFPRAKAEIVPALPALGDIVARVRYWDKAATAGDDNPDADWSVGVKLARHINGFWFVEDVVREQVGTAAREALIRQTARLDGVGVPIVIEQEPGSGGKDSAYYTITGLAGFTVHPDRPDRDLLLRSKPLAAQWQVGNVKLVSEAWNSAYLSEMNGFDGQPSTATKKDDQVSATAGAFNWIMREHTMTDASDWETVKG